MAKSNVKFRFTIGWRMAIGFGFFTLAVVALFVQTRLLLGESRVIGERIDTELVPSIEAIEKLKEQEQKIYNKHRKLQKELKTHINCFNHNNNVNLVLGYKNDLDFVDNFKILSSTNTSIDLSLSYKSGVTNI